jgi:hypothetical protein
VRGHVTALPENHREFRLSRRGRSQPPQKVFLQIIPLTCVKKNLEIVDFRERLVTMRNHGYRVQGFPNGREYLLLSTVIMNFL